MPRPGGARRPSGPTLTIISWRAIPAQVVATDGERTVRRELHRRFQVAIDRAAVKAGRRAMQAYIAEWRRTARPCAPDLDREVADEVARLEAAFTREVLAELVAEGGARGETDARSDNDAPAPEEDAQP